MEYKLKRDIVAGEIPYLKLDVAERKSDDRDECVLLLHGMGGSKEHSIARMMRYADAGFRVFAMDLRRHGERRNAVDWNDPAIASSLPLLTDAIVGSATDITTLLDALHIENCAIDGLSLGAIVGFAALPRETRLAIAALSMGSPDWDDLMGNGTPAAGSANPDLATMNPLYLSAHTVPTRPLLMQHGADDEIVRASGSRKLYELLNPYYREIPDNLRLVIFDAVGHEYIDAMWTNSLNWISEHRNLLR